MNLLITGADGFVGGHARALLGGFGLDDHAGAVDLLDVPRLRKAVTALKPDAVLHLAAQSHVPTAWADPEATRRVNVDGTRNLLEALAEAGFAGRMLYVGSGDTYGRVDAKDLPVTESHPQNPANPYAASKVEAERLCREWSARSGSHIGFEIILARPFNHVGPGQSEHFAVMSFARQIARMAAGQQPPLLQVGNVAVSRDFTDVRDVVRAYAALLERGRNGEVYNVCSGVERRLDSVIAELLELAGVEAEVQSEAGRMRPEDQPRMVGDPGKLALETGWRPEISWRRTLTDLLHHWSTTQA